MKTDFGGRKTSLCYLEKDGRYLILHRTKKEHDENQDKWIGVGGKFEPGETPDVCALREVKEETGLTMTDYRLRGLIIFVSDVWGMDYAGETRTVDVHIGTLRTKLGKSGAMIETVRGVGYRMRVTP